VSLAIQPLAVLLFSFASFVVNFPALAGGNFLVEAIFVI